MGRDWFHSLPPSLQEKIEILSSFTFFLASKNDLSVPSQRQKNLQVASPTTAFCLNGRNALMILTVEGETHSMNPPSLWDESSLRCVQKQTPLVPPGKGVMSRLSGTHRPTTCSSNRGMGRQHVFCLRQEHQE
jgi:hypothetical protein